MGSVLLFFIDGIGIGPASPENPLSYLSGIEPLNIFTGSGQSYLNGGILAETDACLGIPGRPQSASGQATILTGKNAPAFLGMHKQGFPNEALRGLINKHSIFKSIASKGLGPACFANAYTKEYFEKFYPRWKSATTVAVEAAGLGFRMVPDLLGGFALYHDITNYTLRERGYDIPLLPPAEAGIRLARIAAANRFTLFEHFITDKIGHARDKLWAAAHLPLLAECIRALLGEMDLEKDTLLLTSDHGNIEDLSVKNHTLNMVPTIIWGRRNAEIAAGIKSLADIAPAIISLLSE